MPSKVHWDGQLCLLTGVCWWGAPQETSLPMFLYTWTFKYKVVFEGNLNWLTTTTSLWSLMFCILKTREFHILHSCTLSSNIYLKKYSRKMGPRYPVIWASLVAQTVKKKKKICLQCRRPEFDSGVRKIPWRREWLPASILAWRILWIEEPGGL